jgi:hypothetical protein
MRADERRPTMEAPHETGSRSRWTLQPGPRSTLDVGGAALTEQRELHMSGAAPGDDA